MSEQHFLRQFQDIVNIQLESTRYNCVMDDKDIFEDANNKINQLIAVCVTSKQEQIENKP